MRDLSASATLLAMLCICACRPDARDDQFARRALAQLRAHDSTVQRDFDPQSSIDSAGWSRISTLSQFLVDTSRIPVLIAWERGSDPRIGAYRRLDYWVGRIPDSAVVTVWLVNRRGRTYINTLKGHAY
jgi:hypothetical protein